MRQDPQLPATTSSADLAAQDVLRAVLNHLSPAEHDTAVSASATSSIPSQIGHDLLEIVNLALQIHGRGAKEWFTRPEPELGFVHPATLLRDPANGPQLVKQTLMNHVRGVYALNADNRILPVAQTAPLLDRATRKPKRRKKK